MSLLRTIAQRAHRSARIAQAHRQTHEAAALISPASTTVDLARAENLLRDAVDKIEAVRREIHTDELRAAATQPLEAVT